MSILAVNVPTSIAGELGSITAPMSKEAAQIFRYVSKEGMASIKAKIEKLGPTPSEVLESFQKKQYGDPIFDEADWELYATRSLMEGELNQDDYAALMLFSDCQRNCVFLPNRSDLHHTSTFTAVSPASAKHGFNDDLRSCLLKRGYPSSKVDQFINSLHFEGVEGDSILVLHSDYSTALIKALDAEHPRNAVLMRGDKGQYIFIPKTMKKFIQMMENPGNDDPKTRCSGRYFRAVDFEYVHGLGASEDFEKITSRIITIPHKEIPNGSVHEIDSTNDGLGIYLHDVYYHILQCACYVPISHADIYIKLAQGFKAQDNTMYNIILDLNLPAYREWDRTCETDTDLLIGGISSCILVAAKAGLGNALKKVDLIDKILQGIPDLLRIAGIDLVQMNNFLAEGRRELG